MPDVTWEQVVLIGIILLASPALFAMAIMTIATLVMGLFGAGCFISDWLRK